MYQKLYGKVVQSLKLDQHTEIDQTGGRYFKDEKIPVVKSMKV